MHRVDELCKTCTRWMDICPKKDTIQKLNIESDTKAYILNCKEYERRNEKEVRNG